MPLEPWPITTPTEKASAVATGPPPWLEEQSLADEIYESGLLGVLREYTARCWEPGTSPTSCLPASPGCLLVLHEGSFVGMMNEGVSMTYTRFVQLLSALSQAGPRCRRPEAQLRRRDDHRRPHRGRRQRAPGAEAERQRWRLVRRVHRSQHIAQHWGRDRGNCRLLSWSSLCNRVLLA